MSSRYLAKVMKKDHGHVRQLVREAVKCNVIAAPGEADWVCSQNKNTYQEYVLSGSDIMAVIKFNHSRQPKRVKKATIPKSVRRAVFELCENKCTVCQSQDDLCIDHITPESRGGTRTADNLQVLCRSCNSKKGVKTMAEWLGVSL